MPEHGPDPREVPDSSGPPDDSPDTASPAPDRQAPVTQPEAARDESDPTAADAVPGSPAAAGRRLLTGLALLLAVSAGLLWSATLLPWLVILPGEENLTSTVVLTGADAAGWLTPTALLALAAVAALVALGGLPRRIVGGLLVVAGAAVVWAAVVGGDAGPADEMSIFLGPLVDQTVDEPPAILLGRVAAGAGGLTLAVAGLWTALRGGVLPTLGSRYTARRTERTPVEPDRRMWDTLNEGTDPTEEDR
ncbi:Trp biosynthesis-associated membrane protein [Actinoalloteichus fjordicus]|uniref:Tryptophan-associated transmembrane protein n=1 Tax=Actinoalloteichus fjordicus TaxID=1612552 RepID=A0AAC9LBZ9_9PSEU|nr:Trp biosynthesis-associated membrane protein [Actinoalloteichus fjordicus]APU14070.1 Tryptophan-associated transmembrane protein [Actinoalloteichus fjordicus]